MKKMRPIVRNNSGKYHICDWIISHFPENYTELTYVEPYCNDINVFLNKKASEVEVINDLDFKIVSIYQALRNEPKELAKRLFASSSGHFFDIALGKTTFIDYMDHAENELILRTMSRGGLKKSFHSENLDTVIEAIPQWAKRLKETFIFNKLPLKIIKSFNEENVLLYCNPPYLHETKVLKTVYSSDMSTDDHIELSHALNSFNGKAIISGYSSPLYNRLYKNWNIEKKVMTSKEKKTEVIWKNY